MSMEQWWSELTGENRRTWRKTYPSATLSTTNPTWVDTGVNSGLGGERSVTNCLGHGTAIYFNTQIKLQLKVHIVKSHSL
jgi:hypothetical protein